MKNLGLNGYEGELSNISFPCLSHLWCYIIVQQSDIVVVNLFSNTIKWLYLRRKRLKNIFLIYSVTSVRWVEG